jgi:hypothetical protein
LIDAGLEPPKNFVRPYLPRIEWVMRQPDVERQCRAAAVTVPDGHIVYGCQYWVGETCYIIRVPDEQIRRHELAHCNGWKHP